METQRCKYARDCGGCRLSGIPYARQLEQKQAGLERLLGSFGPVAPILPMKPHVHCRCKVIRSYNYDGHRTQCGIYSSGTHRIVPVEQCRLENELACQIQNSIRRLLIELQIPAYNERNGTGLVRHVLVRTAPGTGQALAVLVTASPILPRAKLFVQKLRAIHPEIRTVVQNVNSRVTPIVLGPVSKLLYGSGYIEDTLCGCTFRVSADSFFQVNPAGAELLYAAAIRAAALTGTERVFDAYCGTGTIGCIAASGAREVIGVELNESAVLDARRNARRNGLENVRFFRGDAGEFLQACAEEGEKADVVFLDPPRSGSTPEFLDAVRTLAPERVVYVSCSAESLARDLKLLTADYTVKSIEPVDLFPETEHVETVVLLSRNPAS